YSDSCIVKNPDVIVKIFNLSRFTETPNSQVLKLASAVPLAWTQSFWTCSVIVVMLASCNLRVLALIVWDSMPVIRTLLELCISQHYSFPPPNYTSRSEPSAERLLRLGIQADENDRECVLVWEREALVLQGLWDNVRGNKPLEPSESEYVGWLMRLDFGPSQPARAPPAEVMQQLKGVNERFGLGMKLASSRDPDYLGRMVGNNDDAAWVDRLLRDVPEILNALPASTLCARYCRSIVLANGDVEGTPLVAADKGPVDSSVKKKLVGYLENVMATDPTNTAYVSAVASSIRFQEVRDIFEYFLVRLCPSSSARSADESDRTVQEAKMAMDGLFQGDLRWPSVLLQTVIKTSGTGFLWKALQWIDDFISAEADVQWIAASLQFLLRIESGGVSSSDQSQELSLLTISRLLTRRIVVFDWLVRDRETMLRKLMNRVDAYFSGQDSVMEDVSAKAVDHGADLEFARAKKVQVELSGGVILSTYPDILRLALLNMSVGEVDKHDGSTWSRLFKASSEIGSHEPKKLADGRSLISCDPAPSNDMQLRLRLIQFSQDAEVVRVAMDGLSLVQVIDLAKSAFGVDIKTAQVVHDALSAALGREPEQSVPVHLGQSTSRQLMLLLQYYADHGGQSSLRALELVKTRFNLESTSTSASSTLPTSTSAVLPNFFQLTA
ncbi:Integrator complex subunit 1, partial [Mortierella sp. GBA30]